VAYLSLMIPFFFALRWIEYAVTKSYIKVFNAKEDQKTIKAAVFKANVASYIILLVAFPSVSYLPDPVPRIIAHIVHYVWRLICLVGNVFGLSIY
ncbi:MAG: hypothetical protein LBC30_04255, partial [Puniceicoccales bacterium]|jgi:hypothetical protein|nr:hypothetical protein [Puniceicoccales bacterium]